MINVYKKIVNLLIVVIFLNITSKVKNLLLEIKVQKVSWDISSSPLSNFCTIHFQIKENITGEVFLLLFLLLLKISRKIRWVHFKKCVNYSCSKPGSVTLVYPIIMNTMTEMVQLH